MKKAITVRVIVYIGFCLISAYIHLFLISVNFGYMLKSCNDVYCQYSFNKFRY